MKGSEKIISSNLKCVSLERLFKLSEEVFFGFGMKLF